MDDPERPGDVSSWFIHYPAGSPELTAAWESFNRDAGPSLDPSAYGWRYCNLRIRPQLGTMVVIALVMVIHSTLCILASLGKLPVGSGKGSWIGLGFSIVFALAFLVAIMAYAAEYTQTLWFILTRNRLIRCNKVFCWRSVLEIPKESIRRVVYNDVTGALSVRTTDKAKTTPETEVVLANDNPDPDGGGDEGLRWLSGRLADWAGVPAEIESQDIDESDESPEKQE